MPISSRNTASTFAARVGVSCWRLYSCHCTSACGTTQQNNSYKLSGTALKKLQGSKKCCLPAIIAK